MFREHARAPSSRSSCLGVRVGLRSSSSIEVRERGAALACLEIRLSVRRSLRRHFGCWRPLGQLPVPRNLADVGALASVSKVLREFKEGSEDSKL